MNGLIERLQKATGPDRELDGDIMRAVKPLHHAGAASLGASAFYSYPPCVTGLIDDALKLVPEGFRWKLGYSRHVPCNAELIDYRVQMEPNLGRFDGECDSNHAIALCIAALKAHAALIPNQSTGDHT